MIDHPGSGAAEERTIANAVSAGSKSEDLLQLEGRPFRGLVPGGGPLPQIPGYHIAGRIHSSAQADVYVAYRRAPHGLSPRVVVKWISRSRPSFSDDRASLLDEAVAMSYLDHPNVARLADVRELEAGVLLAVDYVDGIDLRRMMEKLHARAARLPVFLSVHIVLEVLRGLEHVHRATRADGTPLEIIHRDVTPSNVLISNTGHVVLADFGIVRMRDRRAASTSPGTVKGKVRFLAPEYLLGGEITQSVDIFAAGVVLFELLTGNDWLHAPSSLQAVRKLVNEGLPLDSLRQAGVPNELYGAVALATEREPGRRFSSARDMMGALEAWMIQNRSYTSSAVLAAHLAALGLTE